MRREGADSPDRLFGLFPLTIMVRIPRYRLTVGRQVAEEREGQDLAREVARAAMD
jgi:hypothetical protein